MKIRLATNSDKRGIHEAHMTSIQKLCSKDYTEEQIQAWGHREYLEERRTDTIKSGSCWVVEDAGMIYGFGEMGIKDNEPYVFGLYFMPEATGKGLAKEIVRLMELKAKEWGKDKITLQSTITSLNFYKKMGFMMVNENGCAVVRGVRIPCLDMEKELP